MFYIFSFWFNSVCSLVLSDDESRRTLRVLMPSGRNIGLLWGQHVKRPWAQRHFSMRPRCFRRSRCVDYVFLYQESGYKHRPNSQGALVSKYAKCIRSSMGRHAINILCLRYESYGSWCSADVLYMRSTVAGLRLKFIIHEWFPKCRFKAERGCPVEVVVLLVWRIDVADNK